MARIIIVDDDDLVIDTVIDILEDAGHSVSGVEDGASAAIAISAAAPDLVILDCGLPGRAGISILRDLRKNDVTSSLPVLMLSSRSSDWYANIARSQGANDYMSKPFMADELLACVENLLRAPRLFGEIEKCIEARTEPMIQLPS